MPTAHTNRLHVTLTREDRATLDAWQHRPSMPAALVRRGRVVLLLADGVPVTRVAALAGLSRRHVYKWLARFLEGGVAGLADLPKGPRGPRGDS